MSHKIVQEAFKGCPDEVADLIGQFLPKGKESEVDAKIFFKNVSRNMVLLSKKCPLNDHDPNFKKHFNAVLGAFEKRRDGHKCFGGKWSTYLNDHSKVWKQDYDKVWSDYIKGKLV